MIILLFSISCNKDFEKIRSDEYYSWARKDDTLVYKDTLTFTLLYIDSIAGHYNFMILPGHEGHGLTLYTDSTFSEKKWSDCVQRFPKVKGKWSYANGVIILKSGRQELTLLIHQYKWTTFLVLENKKDEFAYRFNKNKRIIDSLSVLEPKPHSFKIDRELYDMRLTSFFRLSGLKN
jgi:hypothetical protein